MEEGFFSAFFKKIKKFLKKHGFELFLIALSFIFFLITFLFYLKTINQEKITKEEIINEETEKLSNYSPFVFIDVSGAVKKPGLYKLNYGSRLKEAIDKAGGLNEQADVIFFQRNFNLAEIIHDQEKIYIPTIEEVISGLVENKITLYQKNNFIQNPNNNFTDEQNNLININLASAEELDQLPGVGPVTAQKIIDNRPYQSLEELLNKKVVSKSVYEKIKNQISL